MVFFILFCWASWRSMAVESVSRVSSQSRVHYKECIKEQRACNEIVHLFESNFSSKRKDIKFSCWVSSVETSSHEWVSLFIFIFIFFIPLFLLLHYVDIVIILVSLVLYLLENLERTVLLIRHWNLVLLYWWSVFLHPQVTGALAHAGLESSNLIVGIDFTKSNEWTGLFQPYSPLFKIFLPPPHQYLLKALFVSVTTHIFHILKIRCKIIQPPELASHWRFSKSLWTSNLYYWENIICFWWG